MNTPAGNLIFWVEPSDAIVEDEMAWGVGNESIIVPTFHLFCLAKMNKKTGLL